MRKKRIMLCGEASFLATGYSTIGLEFLKYLHATDKFELMEFSAFGSNEEAAAHSLPWKFFSCLWDDNKPGDRQIYDSDPRNAFGAWKFEEACLEFRPDFCMSYNDFWMFNYQGLSPFRQYFNWAIMPAIDSSPPMNEWVDCYASADICYGYSDFAVDVMKRYGGGKINIGGATPPGTDLKTFQLRQNRLELREAMGVSKDSLIIGTVMRNQVRKLYPDLIEAFAQYLHEGPEELTRRSFLYLHTGFPDQGWDIPELLKENGVASRVLFTYICQSCGMVFPAFFQDSIGGCPRCKQLTARLPSTHFGVSREALSHVYQIMDCYVQYACAEAQGMPLVEAAASGIPVFAVDYSAMADVVRKLNGTPIAVQRLFRDHSTMQKRALPENADLVKKLIEFFQQPYAVRAKLGYEARKGAETHYRWENTCGAWEKYFDSVPIRDETTTWCSPTKVHKIQTNPPDGLTNEGFVNWGLANVAGRPDLINSYLAVKMTRELNWEARISDNHSLYFSDMSEVGTTHKLKPFSRQDCWDVLAAMGEFKNKWERLRVGRRK